MARGSRTLAGWTARTFHAPDADREVDKRFRWSESDKDRDRGRAVADQTQRNERAAKSQIRAMDIVVRSALHASPEAADRVMRIAREQIADQLGEGREIKPARVRAGPEREVEGSPSRRQTADRQRALRVSDADRRQKVFDARTAGCTD